MVAKEIKRRRLDDLSFSSPGPAFLGTPSSSDAGDEDSDQGIRKRPARLRMVDRTGAMTSSSSSSHDNNTSERSAGTLTPKPPSTQPPRQPSLIRSNNYKSPSSIFRNFESPASPNGKGKVNAPRVSNGHKKGGEVNGSRHSIANGSHSAQHLTNGSGAGASNGHGIRKGATTSITGPSAHPSSSSPSTRTLGRSRRPSSRTRDYDEAYHTPSRPRSSSQTLLPKSTTTQGSPTKREQLLQKKKEELDRVYKEHDGLVRELFHLSKVRH